MAITDDYPSDKTTTGYLSPGGQASAKFEQSADSDWFRTTLAANTYYTFQLEASPLTVSQAYLSLGLRAADGSYFSSLSSNYTGSGVVATFKTGAAGDYYLSAGLSYYQEIAPLAYSLKASAGSADREGDTLQTASVMTVGVAKSGAFEGPSDTDVFKLTLEKGVSYSIKQSWVSAIGSSYASISVANASGQSVTVSNSNDSYSFTAAASGDYYISTRGGNSGGAALNYSLLAAAAVDDYKATASGAGTLSLGTTTKGKLEVGGDKDWYAVTLNANSVYWFTAKADTGSSGSGYNSGNTQLKILDGTDQVLASIAGSNSQTVLQFIPTKTGTYYFEVGDGYNYTGNYLASVITGQRDDYGNTKATAGTVTMGSTLNGKLELATDTDMFKFAVKAGSTYLIELTAQSGVNGYDFALAGQDASGSSGGLVSYTKAGVTQYRVYTATSTGDYYLTVGNGYSSGPASYALQVSTPASDDYAASTATTALLSPGAKVAGAVDYIGDVDWVKVKLVAGNNYAFVLEGQESGQGTLNLYGVGLSVASGPGGNYYYGLNSMSGMSGKGYTFNCDTTGDYYLAVTPGAYSNTPVTGTYALNAYNLSGDTALPALVSFAPGNGSSGASLTGNITLTFNDMVRVGEGNIRLIDAVGNVVESFYAYSNDSRLQVKGNVVTINPTANLQPGTKYTLEMPAGSLLDYAGNKFLADAIYNFTTVSTVAQGGSGNDLLSGIGTNVRLSGGDGVDTVVYGSNWANYSVSVRAGEAKVLYRYGGTVGTGDVLTGVERLQFSDRSIALDADGHGGQAYRMYQAAFNRAPDKEGLGFWMSHLDNGMSLQTVAKAFLDSAEFQARYGSLSNEGFVNGLYTNVLHRAGEAAGVAYWVDKLEHGTGRADLLIGFSESAENVAEIVKVIGNGFEYTPYG
jgi:hypothetical protein